jgi:hypothetical protein
MGSHGSQFHPELGNVTRSTKSGPQILIHEPGETVPQRAEFTVFSRAFRKKWDTTGGFMY